MSTTTTPPTPLKIDLTTLLSLLTTLLILLAAYTASTILLPARSPLRTRILFVWHAFDALIHLLLEGSFLYTCFFVSSPVSSSSSSAAASWHFTPRDTFFLADPTRTYGAAQGDGFAARLWQEYARADRRWGGADLTVVSLEILTVGFGTGIAAAVCAALVGGGREEGRGGVSAKAWFWMVVLATGELYGGKFSRGLSPLRFIVPKDMSFSGGSTLSETGFDSAATTLSSVNASFMLLRSASLRFSSSSFQMIQSFSSHSASSGL